MAKPAANSVDEYIAAHPEGAQGTLRRVRSVIRKALPKAEEIISYKIPAYRVDRGIALYFAGWKEHYSLYPASPEIVAVLKDELAPYEVRKGTIRFPLSKPVPARLIARFAKLRAKQTAERGKKS